MRQEVEMLLRGVGDHLLRAGGRLVAKKKPEEVPLGCALLVIAIFLMEKAGVHSIRRLEERAYWIGLQHIVGLFGYSLDKE